MTDKVDDLDGDDVDTSGGDDALLQLFREKQERKRLKKLELQQSLLQKREKLQSIVHKTETDETEKQEVFCFSILSLTYNVFECITNVDIVVQIELGVCFVSVLSNV
jgi:hypothetical protein